MSRTSWYVVLCTGWKGEEREVWLSAGEVAGLELARDHGGVAAVHAWLDDFVDRHVPFEPRSIRLRTVREVSSHERRRQS